MLREPTVFEVEWGMKKGGEKSEFFNYFCFFFLQLSLSPSLFLPTERQCAKPHNLSLLTIHDERRARDATVDGGRGDRRGALGDSGHQAGGVLLLGF